MKHGRVGPPNCHIECRLQENSSEDIGGPPIPVQDDRNLVDNKLFGIGPPIR